MIVHGLRFGSTTSCGIVVSDGEVHTSSRMDDITCHDCVEAEERR